MSITYIDKGDMFYYSVDTYINPVNCVGVAGAGLAQAFRDKYPENQIQYVWECNQGLMRPGHLCITHMGWTGFPRRIINFPTKTDWREKAKTKYIKAGLTTLEKAIHWFDIESIAIPALGCGLGGLKWSDVKPLIAEVAERTNIRQTPRKTRFFIFEPK